MFGFPWADLATLTVNRGGRAMSKYVRYRCLIGTCFIFHVMLTLHEDSPSLAHIASGRL